MHIREWNNKVLGKSAIKKGGHFSRGRPFNENPLEVNHVILIYFFIYYFYNTNNPLLKLARLGHDSFFVPWASIYLWEQ